MKTDEIRKGLWDLKYERHLQKTHSFFNLGIAFSVGSPALLLSIEVTKNLEIFILMFLIVLTGSLPWIVVYPLIAQQRRMRKKVVEWIKNLDKTNFFQNLT